MSPILRILLVAAFALPLLAGCTEDEATAATSTCGNGKLDAGESCDDGDGNSNRIPGACRTDCQPARCGDGVTDPGEACDGGPGCDAACTLLCGNGIVDEGEGCDDGARNDDLAPGACRTSCVPAGCGDGVLDSGEACDDGVENDDRSPDACRTDCTRPRCGDGVRDADEGCDNGAANADDVGGACRTDCTVPRCGDGVTDPGEACDDGAANSDATPDACRVTCTLPRCGDGVIDPGAGETCDDANADSRDGCDRCAFVVPRCGDRPVVDVSGGVPWSGGAVEYQGVMPDESFTYLSCDADVPDGGVPDAVHVVPIPRAGDLVVEVTGLGTFRPSVELRDGSCNSRGPRCSQAPAAGESAVVVERSVTPEQRYRWIVVESAEGPEGTGAGSEYRLVARIVPPLAAGAPCTEQGLEGSCGPGLACADPDGDGAGRCATLVPAGSACDPAGQESLCVESTCVGGTCASTCGDGMRQAWEECDDGNLAAGDNCSPACLIAGRSCEDPFRIDAVPANGGYEWADDTSRGMPTFTASCGVTGESPDLVGAFTAPEAGRWSFRLATEPAWYSALSLVTGSCGSLEELACAAAASRYDQPTLVVSLAAGETVWPVIDGTGDSLGSGTFRLRVERVVCGDGNVGPGEACDDGNSYSGDGCSAACEVEGA